jgi:peptidoglycan/LPS O-acetylase OafA/YrhL
MPDVVQWFRFDHGVPIPYQDNYFSAPGFVQSLFLAQAWTIMKLGIWNGPAWSLSAEVFGYAMFPFLAYVLMRRRSVIECVGIAVCSLSILVLLLVVSGHARDNPTGSFGLIRMAFCFIAGMALSRCFQLLPRGTRLGTPITVGSILFIIGSVLVPAANVLVIFGFAGLIFGLAFRQGPVNRVMESRPVMFMGRISFSFYMIHYIPLKLSLWLLATRFTGTGLGFRAAFLVALAGSCVLLATATFYLFELPFQRLGSQILRRSRDQRVLALSIASAAAGE